MKGKHFTVRTLGIFTHNFCHVACSVKDTIICTCCGWQQERVGEHAGQVCQRSRTYWSVTPDHSVSAVRMVCWECWVSCPLRRVSGWSQGCLVSGLVSVSCLVCHRSQLSRVSEPDTVRSDGWVSDGWMANHFVPFQQC